MHGGGGSTDGSRGNASLLECDKVTTRQNPSPELSILLYLDFDGRDILGCNRDTGTQLIARWEPHSQKCIGWSGTTQPAAKITSSRGYPVTFIDQIEHAVYHRFPNFA